MSRFRRFEKLEKQRPPGSAATRRSRLDERFGPAEAAATCATDLATAPSRGTPGRFSDAPQSETRLRLRDLDDGQPFVRCAHCHADGYMTAVTCSHCGADLTTHEQRAYNEAYWRQRLAEDAQQRAELAKLQAARETAERELAEATRELRRRVAERRTLDDDVREPFRVLARGLGRRLGIWLRRAFPNRSHRIAFAALTALLLAGLVVRFPTQAWVGLWTLLILAAVWGWYRRLVRVFRE